jgi:hypothetical protein
MKVKIIKRNMQPKSVFIGGTWVFASTCAASPNVDSTATLTALIIALIVSSIIV